MPSPTRSACSSAAREFRFTSALLAGAVDQVDGVDHHGARCARRPSPRGTPRSRRPCRRWAATSAGSAGRPGSTRTRRSTPRSTALTSPPAVETCAPISMTSEPLRVRFAPSPTGALHIGGARTALYNWLHARGRGGDAGAADRGHRPRALDPGERRADPRRPALARAGLGRGPAEPVRAPRRPRGADRGAARRPGGPTRTRRPPRTSVPGSASTTAPGTAARPATSPARRSACGRPDEGDTVVDDLIRGEVRFENRLTDDLVIARGDGTPLYNFAVAVDDADMGITDVIRGDDHLSNTPKQLLVLEALGVDAAALRAPAAAARPGREEALEAPRRRLGPGAARRGVPAGRGPQLPRPTGLGHRRRHDAPRAPTS